LEAQFTFCALDLAEEMPSKGLARVF